MVYLACLVWTRVDRAFLEGVGLLAVSAVCAGACIPISLAAWGSVILSGVGRFASRSVNGVEGALAAYRLWQRGAARTDG